MFVFVVSFYTTSSSPSNLPPPLKCSSMADTSYLLDTLASSSLPESVVILSLIDAAVNNLTPTTVVTRPANNYFHFPNFSYDAFPNCIESQY